MHALVIPRQVKAYNANVTLALQEAYRAVFFGQSANEPQKQMVLADLASSAGWRRVSGPDVSNEARAFADGQRSVFGRIFRMLQMTYGEIRELEDAARLEIIADAETGEL